MAYAQLSAVRVRDAATLALEELQDKLGSDASGDERAIATRLRWLQQLADASAHEDEAHRYVTMTPEDFDLVAARYGETPSMKVAAQSVRRTPSRSDPEGWKTV